jgi:hypothetical protein
MARTPPGLPSVMAGPAVATNEAETTTGLWVWRGNRPEVA